MKSTKEGHRNNAVQLSLVARNLYSGRRNCSNRTEIYHETFSTWPTVKLWRKLQLLSLVLNVNEVHNGSL